MIAFQRDDLVIELREAQYPPALEMTWRGKSTAREPGRVLSPLFEEIFVKARSRAAPIEMHFEHIDHFNSSTVTALIQLIQRARAEQIPLVLVFDPDLRWQKLSFDALRVFQQPDGLLTIREAVQAA